MRKCNIRKLRNGRRDVSKGKNNQSESYAIRHPRPQLHRATPSQKSLAKNIEGRIYCGSSRLVWHLYSSQVSGCDRGIPTLQVRRNCRQYFCSIKKEAGKLQRRRLCKYGGESRNVFQKARTSELKQLRTFQHQTQKVPSTFWKDHLQKKQHASSIGSSHLSPYPPPKSKPPCTRIKQLSLSLAVAIFWENAAPKKPSRAPSPTSPFGRSSEVRRSEARRSLASASMCCSDVCAFSPVDGSKSDHSSGVGSWDGGCGGNTHER